MTNRSDNFNRADDASSLGTPSDGGSAWSALAGTWGVSSNQGYCPTPGTRGIAVLTAAADVDVEFTVGNNNSHELVFRASDVNNLFLLACAGGFFLLFKREAGTFTQLVDYSTGLTGGDSIGVRAVGTTIQVFKNGVQLGSDYTSSFNQTAAGCGIATTSSAARFEDFSAAEVVAASFAGDRTHLLTDASGTVTVALTGTNTSWTGSPFSLTANPTGWSVASQNVTSGTAATVTLSRGTGAGTLTISDGAVTLDLTCTATATTRAAGTWGAVATWDAGEPPSAVAAARGVVGHAVTGASGALGDSPVEGTAVLTINSGASLRVDTGATLTVRGDLSNSGTLTVGQTGGGATLRFDAGAASSPSTTNYRYYGNGTAAAFVTRGTSGAHSAVESDPDGGPAHFAGNNDAGTYDCEWCDFSDIGDSATNAVTLNFNTNPGSATAGIKFHDCTFDGCGRVGQGLTIPSNVGWSFRRCVFANTAHADESLRLSASAPGTGVTRELGELDSDAHGVACDKAFVFTESAVTAVWGCAFDGGAGGLTNTGKWPDGAWGANYVRGTSDDALFALRGDVTGGYFLDDHDLGNPHSLIPRDTGAPQVCEDVVLEYTGALGADAGNAFYGDGDWTFRRNIVLPAAGGTEATGAVTFPLPACEVEHCTLYSPEYEGGVLGGDVSAAAGVYPVLRSNLFWVRNGSTGRAYTAVGDALTTDDVVTPAGCTHNGLLNVNATPYMGPFTTAPGADDVRLDATAETTVFVNPDRNIATWAVSRGSASGTYAGRVADARGYLRADPALVADLLAHVRAGFVVKYAPWRTAAHDGTVVGAVQAAPPGGGFQPAWAGRCNQMIGRRTAA